VLSKTRGVSAWTLRCYDETRLIESLGRRGLRRQFGPEALTQLALISPGKAAGFSLDEVNGTFGKDGSPDLPCPALHARADKLNLLIRKLTTTLRDALRHVAECPAATHIECPKFRRLLSAALGSPRHREHAQDANR
jgi:DNA-binding transcriptional MerR regulator